MNPRSTQATTANVLEDREALYYPYIHIRDEEWLKKTLLVVAGMARMIGAGFTPDDSPLVKELSTQRHGQKPLLRRANLADPDVMAGQGDLVKLIEEDIARDAKAFQARFGQAAAQSIRRAREDPYGFQMHLAKTAWSRGRPAAQWFGLEARPS